MVEAERQTSARIFISYRREDSAGFVRALLTPLRERFGGGRIFKDTDNIPPGEDFVQAIQRELESCKVLLAVIGSEWETVEDPRTRKRRLESPNDYLRLELATALKNTHVVVIPVLVDHAGMPSPESLPEDLQVLARRNAIEVSDTRWDTDVERLIHAIEVICNEPASARKEGDEMPPPGAIDKAKPPNVDSIGSFERLELKRKRQIQEHTAAARQAFEIQDFEAVLAACERAIWLNPQEPEARDLAARAQAALDEQKIQAWLAEAQDALAKGELAAASEAIDAALARSSNHAGALKLRQELLSARQERERQREVNRLVEAELKSAQSRFDEEDFLAALNHIDEALALAPESRDALELRTKVVAARDDLRRLRELKRLAQKAVADAQAEFASGKHDAALSRLEQFTPPQELVTRALEDLRRQAEEIKETARQEKARQDAADAAARARRDADASLSKAEAAIQQKNFPHAQELVEAARVVDPAHPDLALWTTRIADAVAAEAAAQVARREREEQAARDAALAEKAKREAEKAKGEKEEQARREEAATRAAREQARRREEEVRRREEEARQLERAVAAKLEEASKVDDHEIAITILNDALTLAPGDPRVQTQITQRQAALQSQRAEAQRQAEEARRLQEARKREERLDRILTKARNEPDDEVAIDLLNQGLTIAPGDSRLQALIGERQTALDRRRAEALEKAAAEEASRREQERHAREEKARLQREEIEDRARQSRERLAREAELKEKRRAWRQAVGAYKPGLVWIKFASGAAVVLIVTATAVMWPVRSPAPGDTAPSVSPPPSAANRGSEPAATLPPTTTDREQWASSTAAAEHCEQGHCVGSKSATEHCDKGTASAANPPPSTANRGTGSAANPPPSTANRGSGPAANPPPSPRTEAVSRQQIRHRALRTGAVGQPKLRRQPLEAKRVGRQKVGRPAPRAGRVGPQQVRRRTAGRLIPPHHRCRALPWIGRLFNSCSIDMWPLITTRMSSASRPSIHLSPVSRDAS